MEVLVEVAAAILVPALDPDPHPTLSRVLPPYPENLGTLPHEYFHCCQNPDHVSH